MKLVLGMLLVGWYSCVAMEAHGYIPVNVQDVRDEYYRHMLHGAADVYFQKLKNPDIPPAMAQQDLMKDIIRITEVLQKQIQGEKDEVTRH